MAGQLVAQRIEAWVLVVNESTLKISTDRETGKIYKSDHYVIQIKRTIAVVSAFVESAGEERSSFTYYIGGGSTISFSSTSKKYICTSDRLSTVDLITGECAQEQTWEYVTAPEIYEP